MNTIQIFTFWCKAGNLTQDEHSENHVNIPKELIIVSIDSFLEKPENAGKDALQFQIFGVNDVQVLFDVAHHFRYIWKIIEVTPPHNGDIASLRFQGRRKQ